MLLYEGRHSTFSQYSPLGRRQSSRHSPRPFLASFFHKCLGRDYWNTSDRTVCVTKLTGENYLNFLNVDLPGLLEEIPLEIRRAMWFMHDGAPAHFTLNVRHFLNVSYGPQWIGRGGPTVWPPRSPDLNSCDFYLWGYMKSMVYRTAVNTKDDLLNRIMLAAERIRNDQDELARVSRSLLRRANACIRANGVYYEFFIFFNTNK
jgi:hypothetical protein